MAIFPGRAHSRLWPPKESLLWTTGFLSVATAGIPLWPQRNFLSVARQKPCGHSKVSLSLAAAGNPAAATNKKIPLRTTRFHFVATAGVPLQPQRNFRPAATGAAPVLWPQKESLVQATKGIPHQAQDKRRKSCFKRAGAENSQNTSAKSEQKRQKRTKKQNA